MADQRTYWDGNLDPKNLSDAVAIDVDEELAFLRSPEYRWAEGWLGDVAGRRVLEIGCGLGVSAIHLARQGARVVALDLSGERLAELARLLRAEGLAERVLLVQGSVEDAPFVEGAFDRATTKSVLIHTELERAAAEIRRVLKVGGAGVFIEPLRGNPFVNFYRRFFAPKIWREIARYFGKEETAIFERRFPALEYHDFFLVAFLAFVFQYSVRSLTLFRLLLGLLHGVDRALFAVCPVLRRLAWMRVFRALKD